ncbi:MAG TPA: TetR/AcrR family transcriptional regulator [Anaerolineales bacterium]|nr:TetR/AcrR family transcriptional regulator [Anaerolineales bacterium]
MSPRPNVTDERTSQIINAAEDVFTKKGFDEARMDDIAEETGLSKGTLYNYFKSKDDLIIAILDRIFQREFKVFESIDLANMSATDAIWSFAETTSKDVKMMMRLLPITYEFMGLAFRNKLVQKAFKTYFNHYMDILVPIIQHGIDSGEFRPADAKEVALAMGAIMEGTLLLWVYDKSLVDPEVHIRSGMKLLLEGVKA